MLTEEAKSLAPHTRDFTGVGVKKKKPIDVRESFGVSGIFPAVSSRFTGLALCCDAARRHHEFLLKRPVESRLKRRLDFSSSFL